MTMVSLGKTVMGGGTGPEGGFLLSTNEPGRTPMREVAAWAPPPFALAAFSATSRYGENEFTAAVGRFLLPLDCGGGGGARRQSSPWPAVLGSGFEADLVCSVGRLRPPGEPLTGNQPVSGINLPWLSMAAPIFF